MTVEPWLLPEGVEELLPARAARLEILRRRIVDVYSSWGYQQVVTPFVEFLDSLLVGLGKELDLQTFKLIDQLSGRMLGVRADMTPQVARIEAHHIAQKHPVRLSYLGTVLRTVPEGLAGNRSPIQTGAELYGHAGVESDCEVVALMVAVLRAAGIGDVHLDLGHVGIYRGLVRRAGLNGEVEAQLYEQMQRKAIPELEQSLAQTVDCAQLREMFMRLALLNGAESVLDEAREALASGGDEVIAALDELVDLQEQLRTRVDSVPIHFDLAELRGYRYHSGPVFAAFTPRFGREIARGGRYDHVVEGVTQEPRSATGFSTDLRVLETLSVREDAETGVAPGVLAPWSNDPALAELVSSLRANGERVIYNLPGPHYTAAELGCDRVIKQVEAHWRLVSVRS